MHKKPFFIISLIFLFFSCEKTDLNLNDSSTNDKVNFFVWRGLNTYYLWQKEVPDLADDRFSNLNDLYSYFRNYNTPNDVFYDLLYQYPTIDRFSWIVDDYIALENSFLGVNVTNGMEFGLVRYLNDRSKLFGYVRYVVPNSDAEDKGVLRGMIFNKVDGLQLTESNYQGLLFGTVTNYTIELADYNSGNPVSNTTTINLTKSEIEENPIKIQKVFKEGNKNIGYLMYNQFARNYNSQLNAAFANFKSENIDELIVDLRYNSGGSTNTATYLGSMITGQFNNQLYSKEQWNAKVTNALPNDRFINNFTSEIRSFDNSGNLIAQESIESLGLSKVYFIVTGSSASASELVINSLSAYIDVKLVGTKTVGKQVGSVTLYDADNWAKNGTNFNNNHTYALQPIVFEIFNKDNQNYPNGIIPGTTLPGIQIGEDFGNLGVLGNRNEPLLSRTIEYILTGSKTLPRKNYSNFEEIYNSKLASPASDKLYIDYNSRKLKIN